MENKKFVKVPLKEYLDLKNKENEWDYLEACGVDNWDPGISKDEWAKENGYESFKELEWSEEDCELLKV